MQFSFSETIVGSVENLELKFWSKNKKLQKVLFPPWNWENKPVSIFVSLLDSPPVGWVPKYSKCVFNHQHKILTLQTCRESSFELKLILKKNIKNYRTLTYPGTSLKLFISYDTCNRLVMCYAHLSEEEIQA